MTEVTITGGNHGVMPTLETWEWPVPAYLFLGGLVAGMMIFGAYLRLRHGSGAYRRAISLLDWAGLPLLSLGLLFLFLDLTNRWNAWRFFTTFELRSAMSWGSWILLLCCVVLALRMTARAGSGIRPDIVSPRLWNPVANLAARINRYPKTIDVVSLTLGIGLGFYTGVLLSSIAARPLWASAALAPLFLISGIASGGAALCLFITEDEHRRLAPTSMAMCGVEGILLFAYIVSLGFGTLAAQRSGELLISGGYAGWFWLMVVLAGLAAPLAIETVEVVRGRIPRLVGKAAPVLKLTGSAALRFVIVFAGLQSFL